MGFEPTTPGITIRCSNQLSYTHQSCWLETNIHCIGAPGRNRTCNRRLRRPVLYPVELRALSPDCRIEPTIQKLHRNGRGRGIRTPDILLPKQARYQTALYPADGTRLLLRWLPRRASATKGRVLSGRGLAVSTKTSGNDVPHRPPSLRPPLQWVRAKVAELVDALALGASAARRAGSSPAFRTICGSAGWLKNSPTRVMLLHRAATAASTRESTT